MKIGKRSLQALGVFQDPEAGVAISAQDATHTLSAALASLARVLARGVIYVRTMPSGKFTKTDYADGVLAHQYGCVVVGPQSVLRPHHFIVPGVWLTVWWTFYPLVLRSGCTALVTGWRTARPVQYHARSTDWFGQFAHEANLLQGGQRCKT